MAKTKPVVEATTTKKGGINVRLQSLSRIQKR